MPSVDIRDENGTQYTKTNPFPVRRYGSGEYEAVGVSATDQVLGGVGAIGDYCEGLLIQPGTTTPGSVILKDGSTTIYTFPGGTTTVVPFFVPINAFSVNGGWKVSTGLAVTVLGTGDFT